MKRQTLHFLLMFLLCFCVCGTVEAKKINIQVTEGDVRAVLLSTARMGGYNLVIDDAVMGTVSLNLAEVEPLEVLQSIVKIKHLFMREKDGIYFLYNEREKERIHPFVVMYGDGYEISKRLNLILHIAGKQSKKENTTRSGENSSSDLVETEPAARVVFDSVTNQILFRGTPEEAEEVREIIRTLDVKPQQVSLEARVLAIQKDAAKKLGVTWEWSALPQYPDVDVTYDTKQHSYTDPAGNKVTVEERIPHKEIQRHMGVPSTLSGIVQFGKGPEGMPFEWYYAAKLDALVTDGKANILARPNITTLQGKEAVIRIGGSVPVPTVTTSNNITTTSVVYQEAGIILRYTPWVQADGTIAAEVHTEVSSPIYVEDLKAYRFQKRSADTNVRLKDGDTMVIGGLIGSEESHGLSKIPFLGDLPILGAFFRSVRHSKSDSEIIIFLTAHIFEG